MSVESTAPAPAGSIRSRIAAHPVAAFLLLAIPLAWLAQCLAILLLQDVTPGLLVELLVLLGAAVLVTAATDGRPGVRRLFSGVVRWRVGAGWYVIALLALPILTLLTAVVTGTLREPGSGWAATAGIYLLKAVVVGAVLRNIWEELAWAGVVQRLIDRKGVLARSLLTAIPFALIHLLQFIPAVVVLTAAVAAYLAVRSRTTTGQGSSGHALRRRRIRPVRPANP